MKKNTFKLFLLFILLSHLVKSQTPDRWDTLYNQTTIAPIDYFEENGIVGRNSTLFLYGDSINLSNFSQKQSYIAAFNPTTSAFAPLNYTHTPQDYGLKCDAAITTATPNLSYAFFGSKLNSESQSSNLTLYKLNTQNNTVTYDQLAYSAPGYRSGITSLCFFSPTSNHDTLLVFDDSSNTKTTIYKKHYNQPGFASIGNLTIPIINANFSFVFNNVLYVSGLDTYSYNGTLMTSTNGVTFTTNSSYTTTIGNYQVVAGDTLNNVFYFAIYDGDGDYAICKTPDGINFTQLTPFSYGRVINLKKYKNKIWYSVTSFNGRPAVRYLSTPSMTLETSSVEDIGKEDSYATSFHLCPLNSNLYFAGSYEDGQTLEFGTFIYEFIPPVANFTVTNTQLCLNSSYTATNTSLSADSVRWIKDNNFNAAIGNNYTFSFNTSGSHTVGIIAISGTQKDTLRLSVNVYSISATIAGPATACQITPFQLNSTPVNAQGPNTYIWQQIPTFTTAPTVANPTVAVPVAGTYSYYLNVIDVNGCSAITNTVSVVVYSSKDISGVVTTAPATPVAGDAVLYKYVPILTKFDSVTYQPLTALGEYTFSTVDSGTYIIKCIPTATSLQVSYGNSSISWLGAHVLTHGCINTSTQNISVIPFTNLGVGNGILSGKITEGVGYGQRTSQVMTPGAPIRGVIVKGGRNPGGDISTEARTNSAGEYTLSGMPISNPGEDYFVLVDIPGLDTNTTYHRVITATSLQYLNLDFVVDSAMVNPIGNFVGVKEINIDNNKMRVYPNPTSGKIAIEFELSKPAQVKVEVVDILGRTVKTLLPVSYQNEIKITTDLNGIKQGVYFIKVNIDDAERSTKLIVTD